MIKYSIVIPTWNNIEYTAMCIKNVMAYTKGHEIIVVDGGSSDGTWGWLQEVTTRTPKIKAIRTTDTNGFSHQVNIGIAAASGEYIVVLNNDVLVTPLWAEKLCRSIEEGPGLVHVKRVGLAGPVSNYVGGRQQHPEPPTSPEGLEEFASAHARANQGKVVLTGFLSGFCMMIKREVIEEIGGFDERFDPGGFEDNDFVLRAEAKGYRAVIAVDCFVWHWGGRTLWLPEFKHLKGGLANRKKFLEKWYNPSKKKLVAMIRVRNQAMLLRRVLKRTEEFADEIVVLCDRCTDGSDKVAREFEKVTEVIEKQGKFDEYKDRA
ncbi:MAG TPA: glycosyltransferase family 2 protein, partial [Desulfobacterales bacterium]|nr:glycosyltransferase family 2 protein [Desulfobacterales bacterium]